MPKNSYPQAAPASDPSFSWDWYEGVLNGGGGVSAQPQSPPPAFDWTRYESVFAPPVNSEVIAVYPTCGVGAPPSTRTVKTTPFTPARPQSYAGMEGGVRTPDRLPQGEPGQYFPYGPGQTWAQVQQVGVGIDGSKGPPVPVLPPLPRPRPNKPATSIAAAPQPAPGSVPLPKPRPPHTGTPKGTTVAVIPTTPNPANAPKIAPLVPPRPNRLPAPTPLSILVEGAMTQQPPALPYNHRFLNADGWMSGGQYGNMSSGTSSGSPGTKSR